MREAERAFGRLQPGQARVARPAPKAVQGPFFHAVRTDSAQVEIQMLFLALPDKHPMYPALIALLRVLDDGMSTPLHYRVCDRKGLAYHVNAGLDPLSDTSLIEISAACASAKLPALMGEILPILDELKNQKVAERELDKAKRRYARDLEAGFDDVEGLCAWYGDSLVFGRPLRSPEQRFSRMSKVRPVEIQQVAQEVLRADRLIATAVGSFEASAVRQVRALLRRFGEA
jgi:predicted Zn-dependent peptidase